MTGESCLVEMLGLPGSGKSTLALAVSRLLLARGVPVALPMNEATQGSLLSRRTRSVAGIAGVAARRPGYALRSLQLVAATRQVPGRAYAKVSHNWLHVSARFARSDLAGIRLFDQGMYQALWSIAYGATAPGLDGVLAELDAIMPHPDVVVRLHVEPSVAAHRLVSRPGRHSRVEADAPGSGSADEPLRRAQRALQRVFMLPSLSDPGGRRPRVIDVDNNAAQETAAQAARLVASILEPSVPAEGPTTGAAADTRLGVAQVSGRDRTRGP